LSIISCTNFSAGWKFDRAGGITYSRDNPPICRQLRLSWCCQPRFSILWSPPKSGLANRVTTPASAPPAIRKEWSRAPNVVAPPQTSSGPVYAGGGLGVALQGLAAGLFPGRPSAVGGSGSAGGHAPERPGCQRAGQRPLGSGGGKELPDAGAPLGIGVPVCGRTTVQRAAAMRLNEPWWPRTGRSAGLRSSADELPFPQALPWAVLFGPSGAAMAVRAA
jgi:hypothetical protein